MVKEKFEFSKNLTRTLRNALEMLEKPALIEGPIQPDIEIDR